MDLSTPTLLFGAISLIMLAYTNRFFMLGQLVRSLVADPAAAKGSAHEAAQTHHDVEQIRILKKRLRLMVITQALGVLAFILCSGSTVLLFFAQRVTGSVLFVASVLALMLSLVFFLWEILISTKALNIVICDFERGLSDTQNTKSR